MSQIYYAKLLCRRQVTVPLKVRQFLKVKPGDSLKLYCGLSFVFVGKYDEVKDVGDENHIPNTYKCTLTEKGQIAIPTDIVNALALSGHNSIKFIIGTEKDIVYMYRAGTTCFLCNGSGTIEEQECPFCKNPEQKEVLMDNDIVVDFIKRILNYNRKYKFNAWIVCKEGFVPDVLLCVESTAQSLYSQVVADKIADFYQLEIIKRLTSGSSPLTSSLKELKSYLKTVEAQKKLESYFENTLGE